jgi:hypothetical protein
VSADGGDVAEEIRGVFSNNVHKAGTNKIQLGEVIEDENTAYQMHIYVARALAKVQWTGSEVYGSMSKIFCQRENESQQDNLNGLCGVLAIIRGHTLKYIVRVLDGNYMPLSKKTGLYIVCLFSGRF